MQTTQEPIQYHISNEELTEYLKERISYDIGDYLPVLLPSSFSF